MFCFYPPRCIPHGKGGNHNTKTANNVQFLRAPNKFLRAALPRKQFNSAGTHIERVYNDYRRLRAGKHGKLIAWSRVTTRMFIV